MALLSARRRGDREAAAPIELPARVDALDGALAIAEGRLDPELIARARTVLDAVEERLGRTAGVTVAALGGGTGSGKSSLLNAVAGAQVSATGACRPVTRDAVALVAQPADGAEELLDWLGVQARHRTTTAADLAGLVLLDLPDADSVVEAHRTAHDRLVERADVLVWVVDPLKYAQRLLHEELLGRFHRHGAVTLVVLNRVDELEVGDRDAVLADLRRLLDDGGLPDAQLLATSATTGEGLPELRSALAEHVVRRRSAVERLAADVASAADALAEATAPPDAHAAPTELDPGPATRALAKVLDVDRQATLVAARYRNAAVDASRSALARRATRTLRGLRPGTARRPVGVAPSPGRGEPLPALRRAAGEMAATAATGLPHPWPTLLHDTAARAAERASARLPALADDVDERDGSVPRWWRGFGALRTIVVLVGVVGLLWLGAIAGADYLLLPLPDPPAVGRLPVPTLLLAGAVLASALLAVLARGLARVGAGRRARRARRHLVAELDGVARAEVVAPLSAERGAHDALRAALDRARA